ENADRSKLEDEIYALWEKVEGVESRIDQTKIDLGRIRHEVDIKAGEIDLEIKRIDGEIAKLNGLIDERLEILNKENAEAYNFFKRLQTKEIIPSAVQLKGSACCGCSCSLPIDVQNKIKEGQLVKCPLCNRFLYYIEEPIDEEEEEGKPEA
ncbi:hypothetical protein ACFL6F_03135, partial [Planctomycetota bacterium]